MNNSEFQVLSKKIKDISIYGTYNVPLRNNIKVTMNACVTNHSFEEQNMLAGRRKFSSVDKLTPEGADGKNKLKPSAKARRM
jgi:hypothetical protein